MYFYMYFDKLNFISCVRGAEVSDCGNWLIVTPLKDCRDNLLYFTPLKAGMTISDNLPLTQVVDKLEADYEVSNEYFVYLSILYILMYLTCF